MDDQEKEKRLIKRLREATEMAAPAVRTVSSIQEVRRQKAENASRKSNRIANVVSGLPGNVLGGMDAQEFYAFLHVTLHYEEMMPQPHDEMCEFTSGLFPDLSFKGTEQHFGLILVPRNCFKSVIYSVGLPLYILWKNKNARILLSGHRHDASKEQLRTIKWNIEQNQDFKTLCGDWKPKFKEQKYAEDAIIIIGRTEALRDPSIDTTGADRSKVGAHPDVVICDDLHSEINVATALMREKVFNHIIAMYPMLQPGGTMLVIGTRWHHADAYGKLLAADQKAIEDGKKPTYKTLIRSCYLEDDHGKAVGLYFPTRLTESFLENQRYKIGRTKFSLWYLNKPIADEDKLFPKEDLERVSIKYFFDQDMGIPTMVVVDAHGVAGEYLPVNVTMTWDPAGINPTDKSDFHGVSIVGCDPNSRWLIPTAEAIKAKPDAVLKRIAAIILTYEPSTLIIESVGQSGVWAHLLRAYMEKQGFHCPPIVFYTPPSRTDKNSRIETLQPKWAAKELIIDYRCKVLIEQLDNFPQLDFDDVLDSVQMHGDYTQPADVNSYDILYDDPALMPESMKKATQIDRRRRLGAWAGEGSTNWASLANKD